MRAPYFARVVSPLLKDIKNSVATVTTFEKATKQNVDEGVAFVLAPRMTGINAVSGFGLTSLAIGIGVLTLTTLLAYASERWLEKPVHQWYSKRRQKI